MSEAVVRTLVRDLYQALEAGDAGRIERLLAPDFVGVIADGMPAGAGTHHGPQAMTRDGWWAIGRAFAVTAQPREWLLADDGRLVVIGRYAGTRRADGAPVDAAFVHVWTAAGDRLTALEQVTDTARWSPGA